MASIREIQNRMKSIRDTMKITNAMYMISSTKLRKARKNLDETEQYFFTLHSMIARIMRHVPDMESRYFDERADKPESERIVGLIVVTSDKGLAGGYNNSVLKMAREEMSKHEKCRLFVIGEVGRHSFLSKNIPIAEHFNYTAQNPTLHRARVIGEMVVGQFLRGELDEVNIIYTEMKNSIMMSPEKLKLLPLVRSNLEKKALELGVSLNIENIAMNPSPEAVLENIVPDSVVGNIYGALVESFCCEQNSRMLAMETANENAKEMIHDLSIQYNRVRQALITQEITEVIAGAKAQKKKKNKRKGVIVNEQ